MEEDVTNYGPTLGIDWNANEKWTFSLSYQFDGEDDIDNEATASIGAEYAIYENLAAKLSFDFIGLCHN
jgi:opacity protein-like surface antigen